MNNTTEISTIKSLFFEVVCRKVYGEENFCMEFIHLEKVYKRVPRGFKVSVKEKESQKRILMW